MSRTLVQDDLGSSAAKAAPPDTERSPDAINFQLQLVNAIEQAVIVTDLSGRIVYWNRFAERLYGWPAAEAIDRDIVELVAAIPDAQVANGIMDQLRQGRTWTGEFTVRRKDGTEFPAEVIDSPLYDNAGMLVGVVRVSRDVTARRLADNALRESENKYRTLVEQASDGIHTYDASGRFLDTNSKLCEMLGYTHDELLRLNVKDLVPAEDLIDNPIRFDALLAGETLLKERRLLRKDGSLFQAEISGKMIQQNVMQGIVRDIAERKNAEYRLKQSEERLRAILEASHDGVLVEDNEQIIYVNRSYLDLLGFDDPEELIGKHIANIIASEDVDRVLAYGRRRLNGEQVPIKYEFKGKKRHGTTVDVEASVSMSTALGHNYITTMVRDITERKRAEKALRSSEYQLRLVTDAIPQLVSFVDREHRYRFVNRAYTEWFQRSREDVVDKHVSEVLGRPAYRALLPEFERALSGEEVKFERLIPYRTGERFINVQYIPEVDAATGEVTGFHAFVRDVSARKQAEEELQRSRVELEVRVEQRTNELKKAADKQVETLQRLVTAQEDERRRIARDLHDQLGQQMIVLRLKLEQVRKACGSDDKLLDEIYQALELTRQLGSEIDFLAWKFRPTVLDDIGLVAALDQYISQWSDHLDIRSEFIVRHFGKIRLEPEIETNYYRITQEALNNVYKHARAGQVNVILERRKDSTVLIIEDDGVGFESESQLALRKGMGLTGMRERASLMGGKFEIESTAGDGTTIYVTVPLRGERREKKNDE